jgi:hypothetical protein
VQPPARAAAATAAAGEQLGALWLLLRVPHQWLLLLLAGQERWGAAACVPPSPLLQTWSELLLWKAIGR